VWEEGNSEERSFFAKCAPLDDGQRRVGDDLGSCGIAGKVDCWRGSIKSGGRAAALQQFSARRRLADGAILGYLESKPAPFAEKAGHKEYGTRKF
jgi:hypothetical protein